MVKVCGKSEDSWEADGGGTCTVCRPGGTGCVLWQAASIGVASRCQVHSAPGPQRKRSFLKRNCSYTHGIYFTFTHKSEIEGGIECVCARAHVSVCVNCDKWKETSFYYHNILFLFCWYDILGLCVFLCVWDGGGFVFLSNIVPQPTYKEVSPSDQTPSYIWELNWYPCSFNVSAVSFLKIAF